jgi:hypothetical protein
VIWQRVRRARAAATSHAHLDVTTTIGAMHVSGSATVARIRVGRHGVASASAAEQRLVLEDARHPGHVDQPIEER